MREIKFRAWDGERMWYPGDDNRTDVVKFSYDKSGNMAAAHVGQEDYDNDVYGPRWYSFEPTPKMALMQSTGLKDKNGIEIYEGDLVKWDDCSNGRYWRVAVVEFTPSLDLRIVENSLYPISSYKGDVFHYSNFIYRDTHNHLTIVGNVYANPELLIPFTA
ncbi:YopX family protein [Spirosoma sp. KUDC1026]|uniref:YopX family protein n=1 Tax=Spirosoma sp. KUDC1026 TaxID=2745947 RepID=UPI00159BCF16|nr:YopX family protein [Spirosoma sp. KUDC1026]QKZ15165.1 hypothetical protein HU175_22090 [Spirosoma sp. KUDC1026]